MITFNNENRRTRLKLDLKARKKTPPAKNTKYNLADNIIGKSLEHGLDRIPKTSNAVSHTTSEYGSVGAKRYASADALNSVGELTPMLSGGVRQPKFYGGVAPQHSRTNSLQQHTIEMG